MKTKIEKFLSQFPDNATSWAQATDEVRDLARGAKEIYNEIDLNLTDYEAITHGLQPLNFWAFDYPSQWNTEGKKYILTTFDKMSQKAKTEFYNRFKDWFN